MTDAIRFVFLELGRFNKYIWELETTFDKWMYLLKHMHEMVEIPKEFEDSRFKRLFLLAEIDNFTDEERKQYEESLKNMGDYNNIINTATEEAEKRGLARGREEGKIETIKALIATGVSMESLASALNLSEKEIKSLVSQ
jgi:predicted transposase/invertase (TIGR01784 family)